MMSKSTEEFCPTPQKIAQLHSILKKEVQSTWSIIVATVDPDGIGTAMILKELIMHLDGKAEIYFGGAFSHPQNEMLWNLFELEKHLHPLHEMPNEGPIALADSCKIKDSRFHKELDEKRFRIIVDHHRDKPLNDEESFVYIASCGAASTLAHLLIDTLNSECTNDDGTETFPMEYLTLSEDTATLAAIGILTDTERLTSSSVKSADHAAYAALMLIGSQDKVSESFNYELPPRFYEMQSQCLKAATVIGSFIITRPSTLLSQEEGAYLAIIADHLRKREGIKTVIVWGVTEKALRSSIRTKSKELILNKFIDELFGEGCGGGKNGSGGSNAPLPDYLCPSRETVNLLISFLDASFLEKLEKRVGKKARPEEDA